MSEIAKMMVQNIQSLGFESELKGGVFEKGARAGQPKLEVHVKTGAPVNVFVDLADTENPKFLSFANFTLDQISRSNGGYKKADWIANKKEGGIEKYNQEQGFEFARRFKPVLMMAYAAARDGIDLKHYAGVFKLDNYKAKGAAATIEADSDMDVPGDFDAPATTPTAPIVRPNTTPTGPVR